MTSVTFELPDEQAEVLKARLAAQGLTLKDWFRNLAAQVSPPATGRQSKHDAAAAILELQKHVKPDPEGWTIRDYINSGRR